MESITYHSFIVYVHDQGQACQNEFKIGAAIQSKLLYMKAEQA